VVSYGDVCGVWSTDDEQLQAIRAYLTYCNLKRRLHPTMTISYIVGSLQNEHSLLYSVYQTQFTSRTARKDRENRSVRIPWRMELPWAARGGNLRKRSEINEFMPGMAVNICQRERVSPSSSGEAIV
jgi:hypothetical protein